MIFMMFPIRISNIEPINLNISRLYRLIYILNMYPVQSTPSVDFHFEDATISHPTTGPAFEETDVKYEFSCTQDKKIERFEENTIRPLLDIDQ